MPYRSTKTFEHAFSCAFRQWRAQSHCKYLHGYALSFRIEFEADMLDDRNWVVDFGALKTLKAELEAMFDHRLIVARDDPDLPLWIALEQESVARLTKLDRVGCESFAEAAYNVALEWLEREGLNGRVSVASVECMEHGANSAIFTGGE